MKKYLMTGIAALAMTAGFTSCSSNDDAFDYQENANQIVETYKTNFIKAFGQPAADQNWGFGAAVTRANLNMNGNEWEYTPGVTVAEKNLVFAHVNKDKSQVVGATEEFPYNLENYYVTQVWTGTDTYSTVDKTSTGIVGSSKMNNLHIAETSSATITNGDLSTGWFHVNNFNRGDNTDWSGNTLVGESGTLDFAYHSSEDNNYHNKWIAVPGSAIDASLAGYYYICFDFISYPDDCYTIFRFKVNGQEHTANLPGAWTLEKAQGQKLTYTVYEGAWPNGQNVEHEITIGSTESEKWSIDNVVQGNMAIPADNVYTDWIIRLVEAQPAGDPKLRVFAEDLSATESSDFDFNDVVFDAEYVSASDVKVTIHAAGGTLPLKVNGIEVHEALTSVNSGLANSARSYDKENKTWIENLAVQTTTMINTQAARVYPDYPKYQCIDGMAAYTFHITTFTDWSNNQAIFSGQVRDRIKVEVDKGTWMELTAPVGEPACKVAVPINRTWQLERVGLGSAFAQYVIDPTYKWYEHE